VNGRVPRFTLDGVDGYDHSRWVCPDDYVRAMVDEYRCDYLCSDIVTHCRYNVLYETVSNATTVDALRNAMRDLLVFMNTRM
jgi:hypothetical protein